MTRRAFLAVPASVSSASAVILPIRQILDARAKLTPQQNRYFASRMWPETVRNFSRCGVLFKTDSRTEDVKRSPSGKPIFTGLDRGAINLVVTSHIPLGWDSGRGLTGVATRYEGHDLCVIALNHAHCHQIPFLSVNTCVHELLHVLMNDISEGRPKGFRGETREFRIDVLATRLWLFHEGAAIRKAADAYVGRLAGRAI